MICESNSGVSVPSWCDRDCKKGTCTAIGVALLILGMVGFLWGIVCISGVSPLAQSITLISIGPILVIAGIILLVIGTNKNIKEEQEAMAISRSYQEYRNSKNSTDIFNKERSNCEKSSEQSSKISNNMYKDSSHEDGSDSDEDVKTNKIREEYFDFYPWNDKP